MMCNLDWKELRRELVVPALCAGLICQGSAMGKGETVRMLMLMVVPRKWVSGTFSSWTGLW